MFPASLTRVQLEEKHEPIHHDKYQILLMLLLMHQWLVCKRWSLFFFLFFTEPVNQEGINQRRGRQYWQYVDESTMQHSWETCRALSQKNGNRPTITSAVAFMIAFWASECSFAGYKTSRYGLWRESQSVTDAGQISWEKAGIMKKMSHLPHRKMLECPNIKFWNFWKSFSIPGRWYITYWRSIRWWNF